MNALKAIGIILVAIWMVLVLGLLAAPLAEADEGTHTTLEADEVVDDQPGIVAQEAETIELWVKRHIPVPSKLHIHEGVWCSYDATMALHCKSTPPQAEGAKQ